MYVIYNINPEGHKEFFTGKTKQMDGKRVAIMTKHGDIKIFNKLVHVSKTTLKLEKKHSDQKPFYAADYAEYIREKWRA